MGKDEFKDGMFSSSTLHADMFYALVGVAMSVVMVMDDE
jgi:dsRNA-specific ribonuclease